MYDRMERIVGFDCYLFSTSITLKLGKKIAIWNLIQMAYIFRRFCFIYLLILKVAMLLV